MSRWDALKPDSSRSKKTVASSIGPQRRVRGSVASKPNGRKSIQPQKPPYRIATTNETKESVQVFLRRQYFLWNEGSNEFLRAKVENKLERYAATVGKASLLSVADEDILLMVDYLAIDQAVIRHHAALALDSLLQNTRIPLLGREASTNCVLKVANYCATVSTHDPSCLQCLARLITSQAKILYAEEVARKVVGPILIPQLSKLSLVNEKTVICISETLSEILRYSHHASALLSPLVQDVSPDGQEETVANPIRRKLFLTLQELLFSREESVTIRSKACLTLADTIDAQKKVGHASATSIDNLDQFALEHFLSDQLIYSLCPNLYQPALVLLRPLLRSYPKAMTKFGSLLLFPSPIHVGSAYSSKREVPSAPCELCFIRTPDLSFFLSRVHSGILNDENGAASRLSVDCLADLVECLPLDLWLKHIRPGKAVSGFHRKVVESLVEVLSITRCIFLRRKTADVTYMESICVLSTKLFQAIPWKDDALIQQGTELWAALANSLQDLKLSPSGRTYIVSTLISGMGGRFTPQGELLPMVPPARKWLYLNSSLFLIQDTFRDLKSKGANSETSLRLISAMLRSRPESALPIWDEFEELLIGEIIVTSKWRRTVSLSVLEAFLSGRRDFFSQDLKELHQSGAISELAFIVLGKVKCADGMISQQVCQALDILGALIETDWINLQADESRFWNFFEWMLSNCLHPTSRVIRSSACTASGKFCSEYMKTLEPVADISISLPALAAKRLCKTLDKVISDSESGNARAKALNALGNLAETIYVNGAMELIDMNTTVTISKSILHLLGDENEKVTANAIRSIGHWGSVLAGMENKESSPVTLESLVSILSALAERVGQIVSRSSEDLRNRLNWKARLALKKHGWGACHALNSVLSSLDAIEDPGLLQSALRAVRELVVCLRHANRLAEKVVCSVMLALRALTPPQLVAVAGKSGLVGESLVYCCLVLMGTPETRASDRGRMFAEADLLLPHLLSSASISDAIASLRHEEFTKPVLDFLYGWMVERGVEGRAFEIFALALQRSGLPLSQDVSLEQNFASRALLQYKKEQRISLDIAEDDGPDEF